MYNPFTVAPTGVGYSQNGKITRNDGTNWQNADAKGIWRPFGYDGPQEISFGIHGDRYRLENPVYASAVWNATPSTGTGQLYSDGIGETRTGALWLQDAWKIVPELKLTLGGRLETWRALDGFNIGTTTKRLGRRSPRRRRSTSPASARPISRPRRRCPTIPTRTGTSPPISVRPTAIRPSPNSIRTSRSAGVATFANPNLTPEQDFNGELNIERKWNDGRVRLTLFEERVNNAIISQTNLVTVARRADSDHHDRQRRRNPDAGRRTVGRKGQCRDQGPATVRQRHLCRIPASSRTRPGPGAIR